MHRHILRLWETISHQACTYKSIYINISVKLSCRSARFSHAHMKTLVFSYIHRWYICTNVHLTTYVCMHVSKYKIVNAARLHWIALDCHSCNGRLARMQVCLIEALQLLADSLFFSFFASLHFLFGSLFLLPAIYMWTYMPLCVCVYMCVCVRVCPHKC